ncbi:response regulator [Flavobacterium sp. HJSW_4]|uniref:response regulator n=1 Tax=Flavobacterium sp. HJSW_4 TaxID=3344660 RepID=UPI0035F44DC0
METSMTFVVADDHSMVRQGVSFLLNDTYPEAKVLQTGSFLEILKLVNQEKINLLLLDINFPDGTSLNIIPTIKKLQPNIKILIFSAYDEEMYAMRYLNVGANGYLQKLSTEEEIKYAVNSVITNGKYVSKNIQNKIMDSFILKKPLNPLEILSNREIEIAKLLVQGVSSSKIAETLNIKKTTVSTYKNRVFEKLDINNLSSLISLFHLYYFKEA